MTSPDLNIQTIHKHTLTGNDADRSPSPRGVQLMAAPINGYPVTQESTYRRRTGIDMASKAYPIVPSEKLRTVARGVGVMTAIVTFGSALYSGNDGNINVHATPVYSIPIIGDDTPNSFIDSNGNRVTFITPKSANK